MSAKGVERFARFGRAMGASVPQLFRAGFEPVRDDITLADVNKANAKFYSADGGGYGRALKTANDGDVFSSQYVKVDESSRDYRVIIALGSEARGYVESSYTASESGKREAIARAKQLSAKTLAELKTIVGAS